MEVSELKSYLFELSGVDPNSAIDITKYVIAKDSNTDEEFYINSTMQYGDKMPNFTSIKANNFKRMRIFRSKEDAENVLNEISNDYFNDLTIMTYDEAIKLIGDADARHKEYKEELEQDRYERLQRRNELNKEERRIKNSLDKDYDPGKYRVQFKINGDYWDRETFIVDADSRQEAFEKAKEKALKVNPNYGNPNYDGRLTFNKDFITKE